MQTKLFLPHYDEVFKRMVIEEYLATGCTKMSLIRKYDIQFKSAIQTWMRILGYKDPFNASQKPIFGKIMFSSLPKQSKIPAANVTELQKRVQELERQLEEEKLRSEAYARVIEKAEQELKIPIRKKPNTK
jgi:transposase-like protein